MLIPNIDSIKSQLDKELVSTSEFSNKLLSKILENELKKILPE